MSEEALCVADNLQHHQSQQQPRKPASKPEIRLRELVRQLFHSCPAVLSFKLSFGSHLGVGDAGIMQLAKMLKRFDNLQCIDFGSQRVGDAGCTLLMSSLKRHCSLQLLLLEDNQIGNKGCCSIAAAISADPKQHPHGLAQLTHVDLSYNRISDEGCAALTKAVAYTPLLQVMHIHANSIGDEAVALLHIELSRSCPAMEDCARFAIESSQERWPFHKAQP
jgi:hypothetical protein